MFRDNSATGLWSTAFADERAQRSLRAKQALQACGLNSSHLGIDAVDRLIAENSSNDIKGRNFVPDSTLIKHDLGHIFANATGGQPHEETPATQMQEYAFSDTMPLRIQNRYLFKRAQVMRGMYHTTFGIALSFATDEELGATPMNLFGLLHQKISGRTQYAVMPVEMRKTLVTEFSRLCTQDGMVVRMRPGALVHIPSAGLKAAVTDFRIRHNPEISEPA